MTNPLLYGREPDPDNPTRDRRPNPVHEYRRGYGSPELHKESAAPPPPKIIRNNSLASANITKFTWEVLDNPRCIGYAIYRGLVDNAAIAERVTFIAQPGDMAGGVLTFDDPSPDAHDRFYWVCSVNAVGTESPRIMAKTNFLAAGGGSGSGTYVRIGEGIGDPLGIQDSSGTIRNAEAAMVTTGSVVSFSPGRYLINSVLSLTKANVVWEGYGATLKFNGAYTTRLMNVSASGRIFRGLTFSGNSLQVYGALVYLGNTTAGSTDDGVDDVQFIDCTFSDIAGVHTEASPLNMTNHQYGVFGSPYGVTNCKFINCTFKNITQLNDGTKWKSLAGITVTAPGSGYTSAPTVTVTSSPAEDVMGTGTATVVAGEVTAIAVSATGIFPTAATLTVNISGGGGTGATADAVTVGGFVGGGFCGGFMEMKIEGSAPEVFDDMSTVPTVVSSFSFDNCVFDTIRTILAGSLIEAEWTELNDADAVRCFGGSGVTSTMITLRGCRARKVSKRFAKSSTTSFAAYNCEIICDADVYPMTNVFRLENDAIVDGLRVFCGTALPINSVFTLNANAQRVDISNVTIQAAKFVGVFLGGPGTVSNIIFDNIQADNLTHGGIIWTSAGPTTLARVTISDSKFITTSDNGDGIVLSNDGSSIGSARIYNCEVVNGCVKVTAYNNLIDGLLITINRAGYDGPTSTRKLLEMGGVDGANLDYNILRNCHIDVRAIDNNFVDIDRQSLFSIQGDKLQVKGISWKVPSTLSTTYYHGLFAGKDIVVDGLDYDGHGAISVGTGQATNGAVFRNCSRLGFGSSTSIPFINVSNGASVSFHNVADKRNSTAYPVSFASEGPYLVDGVEVSHNMKSATLTRAGATVTATVISHGWLTGDYIIIFGATGDGDPYNGVFPITSTGANTFTYVITGTPTSPATGTIFAAKAEIEIINDSLATVRNDFHSAAVIRRINTFVVAADSQAIRTLYRTMVISATATRANCTLQSPTREDLEFAIVVAAGSSDIGLVPGTTAIFPQGNPTFGVGSGSVRAMQFVSATISGVLVWVEKGRALVGSASSLLISDTAYDATSWDGVTTIAPSKNAVRDKIQAMISDTAFAGSWNGVLDVAPSKNAVYDYVNTLAAKATPGGPHTVPLFKITPGGADGSISFNAEGVVTAFVDPT